MANPTVSNRSIQTTDIFSNIDSGGKEFIQSIAQLVTAMEANIDTITNALTLSSSLQVDGSTSLMGRTTMSAAQFVNVTEVGAATYDLLATDYILHVTYTITGAVTSLTLPTAQVIDGRVIHIVDAGGNASANNITIDTEGAETINGAATAVITGDYDSLTIYSDGTNWFIR